MGREEEKALLGRRHDNKVCVSLPFFQDSIESVGGGVTLKLLVELFFLPSAVFLLCSSVCERETAFFPFSSSASLLSPPPSLPPPPKGIGGSSLLSSLPSLSFFPSLSLLAPR